MGTPKLASACFMVDAIVVAPSHLSKWVLAGLLRMSRGSRTTTLFAALDIANGSVITQCKPKHRHQEFLAFLRHVEAQVPSTLDVHLICDNYATHKHPRVRAWLARRARFHLHFTPTYSSWLNQVER